MSARKSPASKRIVTAPSARKRAQSILTNETVSTEYLDALKFAVWFNTRRFLANSINLSDSVLKTVEQATRDYILAGQARNEAPKELKRKVVASARRNRNLPKWSPDTAKEENYSLMAGVNRKPKA